MRVPTIKLARLLAANLTPAVWIPPLPVRELRALVTHRTRLVQQRIQARNRLQGVLQRHNLDAPEGKAFARGAHDWWRSLPLSMAEQLRVRQDLALLDAEGPLAACVETHLGQLSITPRLLPAGAVSPPAARPGYGQCYDDSGCRGRYLAFPDGQAVSGLCGSGRSVKCLWTGAAKRRVTRVGSW